MSPAAELMSPETPFDFLRQWYPVSPVEDLDPQRPTCIELMGRRFVIWKPPTADAFRVFVDLCPHRLAPLSEGRIDPATGQLSCSYHGWQFNADGLCRRIPQADPPEPSPEQARHLCATAVPCRQEQGLIWLWPDPASAEQAASTPLPLSPWNERKGEESWSSVVRDLPYDWRTLVENVADPAHVAFAHHGVQGNRENAAPISFEMVREDAGGFEAKAGHSTSPIGTRITFQAPCRLEYAFTFPGDRRMGLISYCLPVGPGRSRIVGQFPRDFALRLRKLVPRWWDHITNRNEVLDGDAVMLRHQELELERRQTLDPAASWKTAYRLPASADRLVIAFRRWVDRHGSPPWTTPRPTVAPESEAVVQPTPPAEQLLDRYHQHTIHCSSCRGALAVIQRLQWAGVGLGATGLGAAALVSDELRPSLGLALVLLSFAGLAGAAALRFRLEPRFRYRPYDHSLR